MRRHSRYNTVHLLSGEFTNDMGEARVLIPCSAGVFSPATVNTTTDHNAVTCRDCKRATENAAD